MTNVAEIFATIDEINTIVLDTITEVKLTGGKKNPMQGRVTKKTVDNSVTSFQNNSNNYENLVKNRLIEEGKDPESFKVSERTWGNRVPNLPIIEHYKDGTVKNYLEVIFLKAGKSEYYLDGEYIDKNKIEGLPVVKENPESQGNLDNKVVIRTFGLDSILSLKVNEKRYSAPFFFKGL